MENDIVPNARNAFELVQANYVAEGSVPARPKISANSMMVAKVMLNSGYKLDSGLGQNLQGRLEPIQVNDKKVPYGLGFKPTKKDKQQVAAAQKRENKLAKLEGRTPVSRGLGKIPPLSITFPKAAFILQPEIQISAEDKPVQAQAPEKRKVQLDQEYLTQAKKSRDLKEVFDYDELRRSCNGDFNKQRWPLSRLRPLPRSVTLFALQLQGKGSRTGGSPLFLARVGPKLKETQV